MSNTKINTKIAVKNAALSKQFEEIIAAMNQFAIQKPGDKRQPALLIYELGQKTEKDLGIIESLLNANIVEEIFLTSEKIDSDILLKAMRIGAKEFFTQPLSEEEIRQALQRFLAKRLMSDGNKSEKMGKIINVIGSKGGIGTTTIAVNLSASIAQSGENGSTALIDMNTIGEIPIFLSFNPKHHWGEITKDIERLDSIFLENVLFKHTSGIQVLPSPGSVNGHLPWSSESAGRMIEVMQGLYDYIVIDGGHVLDKPKLKVLEMSDEVLLVSLLSLPCLANTAKLLTSIAEHGYHPSENIKVVVNRYMKKSEITLKEAKDSVQKEVFWTIPNDYKTTMSAINQGKVLNNVAPRAAISKSIIRLCDSLIGVEANSKSSRWRNRKQKRNQSNIIHSR